MLEITDSSVPYQLASAMELLPRPLLRANLQNTISRPNSIAEIPSFGNSERSGLLEVNVFPGSHRIHCHDCMLVVRRGDDHRIYVFVPQQLMVIGIASDSAK